MDFDLSDDQQALRDAARDLLRTRCTTTRVRQVIAAIRDPASGGAGAAGGAASAAASGPGAHGAAGSGTGEGTGGSPRRGDGGGTGDAGGDTGEDLGTDGSPRWAGGESFDRELWSAMVEQGWLGVASPQHRGGLGLGMVEAAVLLEQTGAHLAPVPFAQQLLAITAMDDDVRCEPLVSGERIGTAARTTLTRHPDGTVSGRTEPVIFGATASVLVTPAGHELVAVDLDDVPWHRRRPEPAMDLTRELAWIELDAAPAMTLGGPSEVRAHLDRGAVFHSAEMLGCAEAVMWKAVDYAKDRHQFGRPIGSFQAVKHRCADMLVDVEGMRSAVYHAAWALGAGAADASVAASTAKVWCSDAGLRVAESALQVHGGIGFTWDCDVHLHLKRAQLDQVAFGDATHHRARLMDLLRSRLAAGDTII